MGTMTAKVRFVGDAKQLVKEMGGVGKALGTLERNAGSLMRAGTALGGALAAMTTQGIAYGTTIDRIAKMTGEGAEEVSGLAYSVELLHGDTGMLEKGLKQLAQRMSYARDGLETYTREFERAGVEYKNADGTLRSVTEVYLDLADAVALNEDGTEALANVMQLLGGRQSQLTPHLKQGSAAIREQMGDAKDLGLVLSNETAEGLEKAGTAVKEIKLAMRGVGVVVAEVASGPIADLSEKVKSLATDFQSLPKPMQEATVKITTFGAGGLFAAGGIGMMSRWIKLNLIPTIEKIGPALAKVPTAAAGPLAFLATMLKAEPLGAMEDIDWGEPPDWMTGDWQGPGLDGLGQLAMLAAQSGAAWSVVGEAVDTVDAKTLEFSGNLPQALGGIRTMMELPGAALTDSFLPAIDLGINKVQEFGYMLAQEFSDNAPQLIGHLIGTVDNAMGKLVKIQGKFGKTMLNATKDYLIDFLDMVVKARIQELMMAQITEEGKISMSALFNPANLLKLAGLSALYAGASAALHAASNASFREGGVVTQSGQYTGLFHAGDAIVGPDAMKAMLSGKGGGGTNIEAHIHVHGDLAMSQGELTDTLDGFANRLAFQMGRA